MFERPIAIDDGTELSLLLYRIGCFNICQDYTCLSPCQPALSYVYMCLLICPVTPKVGESYIFVYIVSVFKGTLLELKVFFFPFPGNPFHT